MWAGITPAQQSAPYVPSYRIDVSLGLGRLTLARNTVPAGTCQFVFTNATYPVPLNFAVLTAAGQAVAQTNTGTKAQHRQGLTVTLAAGTYKVQVVGHSAWSTTLTVTSK
jgi:hypothetical protein